MIATACGLLAATLGWWAKRRQGKGLVVATMLAVLGTGEAPAQDVVLPPLAEPATEIPSATARAFRGIGPAEPLWTSYALAEALFWQRDNQAFNRPLGVTVGDGATVLETNDLQFPVAAGVRTFYGQRSPEDGGWEVGYFGVYGQTATNVQGGTPPNFVQLPEPLGGNLTEDGEFVTGKYSSLLNSAEVDVSDLDVVVLSDRNLVQDPSRVLDGVVAVSDPTVAGLTVMVAAVGRVLQDNDTPVPSYVSTIREDGRLRDEVSTVDNAETILGWVALVLGLEAAEGGSADHYGFREGADRPIPPRMP
jgi:hypothetical protein